MSYISNLSRLLLLTSLLYLGSCSAEWEQTGGDNNPIEQPSTPEESDNTGDDQNEEDNNNEDNTPSEGGNSDDQNEGNEDNNPESGEENPEQDPNENPNENEDGNEEGSEEGNEGTGDNIVPEPDPDADLSITAWNGAWATDSGYDTIGTDKDFFHELNTFSNRVTVIFNGNSASVESNNSSIKSYITGAYVGLDMTSVSGVEVIVKGKSSDGGLKIYSENKYKLTLNGLDLTSKRGPAINSQAGKRVYLHLANGTTNRLTDCATYQDDHYTMAGSANEDRKGALFTEGHIIVSGYGALVVAGKYKHAIVTDGYYYQRPGSTVAVTEAVKNGIHVKGDSDDGIGAKIMGGLINATVSGTAGKGLKCDMDIVVEGGKFDMTTSGNATYDSDSKDTSSASCLKSDTNINIKGGTLNLKSSGTGGKGISADADIIFDGGNTNISTTGGQYKYSSQLTSSPKGIRADGNITINSGYLNISVTGKSEGSEGFESKNTITINGGDLIINSYDDGMNASNAINVNGGRIFAWATNNDGIDSNGTITVNGGLFVGIGAGQPEGGIDVDSNTLYINGGYVLGIGGGMMGQPATSSKQYSVVYGGASVTNGQNIALLDSSNNMLFSFESPITMSATICFSTPDIKSGSTYSVSSGGSVSDYNESWQGWYGNGTWSGGTQLTTFTPSSIVTSIGSSSGGGPGGGGGGWPGGGGNRPR